MMKEICKVFKTTLEVETVLCKNEIHTTQANHLLVKMTTDQDHQTRMEEF